MAVKIVVEAITILKEKAEKEEEIKDDEVDR